MHLNDVLRILFFCLLWQPIYLNLKLRTGTGNETSVASEEAADSTSTASEHDRPPLKKVISINGEEVEVENLDDVNIHDYATFEHEQHLTHKFKQTIRRKSSDVAPVGNPVDEDKPLPKVPSFKLVARDIMRVENVLLALKHYTHRSDSEPDTEDETLNEVVKGDNNNYVDLDRNDSKNTNLSSMVAANTKEESQLPSRASTVSPTLGMAESAEKPSAKVTQELSPETAGNGQSGSIVTALSDPSEGEAHHPLPSTGSSPSPTSDPEDVNVRLVSDSAGHSHTRTVMKRTNPPPRQVRAAATKNSSGDLGCCVLVWPSIPACPYLCRVYTRLVSV